MCCLAKSTTLPARARDHQSQLLLTGARPLGGFVELDEFGGAQDDDEEREQSRRFELHALTPMPRNNEAPSNRRQAAAAAAAAAEEPSKYLDVRLCRRARAHLPCWLVGVGRYLFQIEKMLVPRQVRRTATAGQDQGAATRLGQVSSALINEPSASNQDARLAASTTYGGGGGGGGGCGNPLLLAANLIIFIAHLIAFISYIDYELLGELSSQVRSLTLQNFQARVLHFNQVDHSRGRGQHNDQQPSSCQRHVESPFMIMINMRHASTLTQPDELCAPLAMDEHTHQTATSWPAPAHPGDHGSQLSSFFSSSSSSTLQNQRLPNGQLEQTQPPPAHQQMKKKRTTHMPMHYYLLIVTLMDFLSALHWHWHWHGRWRWRRCRRQRATETKTRPLFRSRGASAAAAAAAAAAATRSLACLLQTCALLLASPKYLFQLMQVLLVTLVIPGEPSESSFAWLSPSLRRLATLMSTMNLLNQMVAYALRAYEASGCQFTTSQLEQGGAILTTTSNPLQQPHHAEEFNQSHQRRNSGELAATRARGNSNLTLLKKLKRYLMISRMCQLKLTLMTLLLHLDSIQKPFELTPASVALSACVIQTFFAMYERYNEYHTSYSLDSTAHQHGSVLGSTRDARKLEIL